MKPERMNELKEVLINRALNNPELENDGFPVWRIGSWDEIQEMGFEDFGLDNNDDDEIAMTLAYDERVSEVSQTDGEFEPALTIWLWR